MPLARPEDKLLLCCARTSRTPEIATRIEALLRASVDWKYLIRTAHAHGMAPLLYWHLNSARKEAIPIAVVDYLREHFQANSLHNLSLTGELLRLLKVFGAHEIPTVPYRGPVLAASVYGNLALRRFLDLDIMVRRRDVTKAKELLTSLGYRPKYRLTRVQEAALLRSRHEYIFVRGDGEITVELHWEITEHFALPLDPERLWGRLKRIPLGDTVVPTLSPEDTLLTLCAHGSKHLWKRLGWICDVAESVRVFHDMRWEQAMAQASALGGERMLLLGLFLANDLLGAALPDRVLRRVHADPVVVALAGQIQEGLFREANGQDKHFEETYFHPLHLKMQKRLPDKIRFCVRIVTTTHAAEWKLLPLPDFLFAFYYVLRPIRLVSRYALRIVKALLGPRG
jgi:hypothetical protein